MRIFFVFLISILLCACAHTLPADSSLNAIGSTSAFGELSQSSALLDQVFIRVKQEVQLFVQDSIAVKHNWHGLLKDLGKNGQELAQVCSSEQIDFQIESVAMEFETETVKDKGGRLSLAIPFIAGAAIGAATPAVTVTSQTTASQLSTYAYYPASNLFYEQEFEKGHISKIPEAVRQTGALVANLDAVRNSLILARAQYPCFRDTRKGDPDQKIVYKVALVEDKTGQFSFSFLFLSAGANVGTKTTGGNTITVTYRTINGPPPIVQPPKQKRRAAQRT